MSVQHVLARALAGDEDALAAIQAINPHLAEVLERTARRLAALPGQVAPQVTEISSVPVVTAVLEDAFEMALAELDGCVSGLAFCNSLEGDTHG